MTELHCLLEEEVSIEAALVPGMPGVAAAVPASNEKTGRWTDEEHTRFLHGLELFGKKWTKVADVVGSRTTVQVRSHAQKYFQKLEKDRAAPSGSGGGGAHRAGRPGGGFGGGGHRGFDDDYDEGLRNAAPIPVPVALHRFMSPAAQASNRAGTDEVASGLFAYLTPLQLPGQSAAAKETSAAEMARKIFDDTGLLGCC